MRCPVCGHDNTGGSSFCNRCGSPMAGRGRGRTEKISRSFFESDGPVLSSGDRFGERYEIIREVDRGGMGRVYQALDRELNITVALKIIHPHQLADGQALERFKKEILLAREISHENVIRIHDFGEEQGIKFISMRFVEGENLKDLIREKGALGVKRTLEISSQICRGLEAAHRRGIVHRDLKPHNIMIDRRGHVYVMDFGLAKSIEGEGISLPDMVVGTPEYISPEQARGEKVDGRSDIYSLGVMMYEMATGKLPFRSETVLGYITKHLNEKPVSPSVANPLIPGYLGRIILKCLEKSPNRRYRDAGALLADFSQEEAARGPFLRRPLVRRVLRVTAVLLLLALVAVGGYLFRERPGEVSPVMREPERRSLAVMYFDNHTGDEALERWRVALADLMISDLAQSRYFRVLPENRMFEIMRDLGVQRDRPILPDTLRRVAEKGHVDHIITGSFTRAGENFRVSIKILDPVSGEYVDSGYADGRGVGSFFSIVDRLTTQVKTRFEIPQPRIMADIDREVRQITTSSPEAFEYYIQGKHLTHLTRYAESIGSFQKAIDLDPEFAMAYWAMGMSYAYLGDWDNRETCFSRTLELLDRVSEREKHLIQGTYFGEAEVTFDKSIAALEKLLELYPEDCEAHEQLGVNYQFLERWDTAIRHLETNRQNGCLTPHGVLYLSFSYLGKGDCESALAILAEAGKKGPENYRFYEFRARVYIIQRKYDLALEAINRSLELDPGDFWKEILIGDVHTFGNDFEKAEQKYRENLDPKRIVPYMRGRVRLANLYSLQGRFTECGRVIENLESLNPNDTHLNEFVMADLIGSRCLLALGRPEKAINLCDRAMVRHEESGYKYHTHRRLALYLKALACLELNRYEEARSLAGGLKTSIENTLHDDQIRFYYHIRGREALATGQYDAAVQYLQQALEHQCHEHSFEFSRDLQAWFYDDLARTYLKKGDTNRALEFYEKITALTLGRLFFGEIHARGFYHMAKIYQEKGWEGKALDAYEKFLSLWRNADLDRPELSNARKQLKRIRSQSR